MSRSFYANYELERKRRLALQMEQAAKTAEKLLRQYRPQLEAMIKKGHKAYIPDEVAELERDLDRARELLAGNNPVEARNVCQHIGAYIGSMDVIANATISQYERAERLRSEQARIKQARVGSNLLEVYYDLVSAIEDPIVVNLAVPNLEPIRLKAETGAQGYSEAMLKHEISSVIAEAELSAVEFRKNEQAKSEQASAESQLQDVELLVKEAHFEDAETSKAFADRISSLRQQLSIGSNSNISEDISQIIADVDDAVVSEETRREAVKAIYQQLRRQEFSVEPPRRFVVGDSDFVRIVARRPSGKQAVCDIDSKGSIKYKFDQYEGMTCLKDIERFDVDLEAIYSLKLSDERVLWSNPDRLTRDANQTSNEDRRTL